MKAVEDINVKDSEVRELRRELHQILLSSPLLLRGLANKELRTRVFNVFGELLHEALSEAANIPSSTCFNFFPFLSNSVDGAALCDPRLGALRLAALLDVTALNAVLVEQFLPALLDARPASEAEAIRKRVVQVGDQLNGWISSGGA